MFFCIFNLSKIFYSAQYYQVPAHTLVGYKQIKSLENILPL